VRGPKVYVDYSKKYGSLTPIESVGKNKRNYEVIRAICDCGKEVTLTKSSLLNPKKPPHCYECGRKYQYKLCEKDYSGSTINNWKVEKKGSRNKTGAQLYECTCLTCGNKSYKTIGSIKQNKSGKCQYCMPDYKFEIKNGVAKGTLKNGVSFFIDEDMISEFSKYYWNINDKGYLERKNVNMDKMLLHWFVLGVDRNHDFIIDHINRDKTDNRRSNLRFVTIQQNCMNAKMPCTNKTGYVGVYYNKRKKSYVSVIEFRGKKIHFGKCDIITGAQMHNIAAKLLHGDYAGHMNEVPEPSQEVIDHVYFKCAPFLEAARIAQLPPIIKQPEINIELAISMK